MALELKRLSNDFLVPSAPMPSEKVSIYDPNRSFNEIFVSASYFFPDDLRVFNSMDSFFRFSTAEITPITSI